jgi:transcriptional regulator with PAS, ATPase and Fis domain
MKAFPRSNGNRQEEKRADHISAIAEIPDELLFLLLDNPYESLILVDKDGIVRFMSSANEGAYQVSVKEAIGRHISEISPNTRLPRVLRTGKAEIGRSMVLRNRRRVIARLPLVENGRTIGAVGKLLFWEPEKVRALYVRFNYVEKKIDFFKTLLNQVCGSRYSFDHILGSSDPIRRAKNLALHAAETDAPIMIRGETGTGKELFAHAIHHASRRQEGKLVRVNWAAIPHDLLEAELFGYEPGAFTGAGKKGSPGKFELAHKGTIFLDEIGDMPSHMQVKLLRVLQEKEVERIGAKKPRLVDFRIICATHQDIEDMIAKGRFRMDLYYRLNVFTIKVPALREIKDDIPLMFSAMLSDGAPVRKKPDYTITPAAAAALRRYSWPGNVRELKNTAERLKIFCRGTVIDVGDLPAELPDISDDPDMDAGSDYSLKRLLAETERKAIKTALQKAAGNKVRAAKMLKIHRTGLYQKMRKYGLR